MTSKRLILGLIVCMAFLMIPFSPAVAQDFPEKEIQLIVPWSAGDSDLITRLMASVLPNHLGKPAVVLNKPGAQGIVGTDYVFKAPADGYTILENGPAHMIVPKIQETPYSVEDFFGLVQMAINKGMVLVNKNSPWSSLTDFIAAAKENPGKITYGSPGKGTWHNFKWELIKRQANIDIVSVPFQGNAPILTALLGGHIDIALIEKPTAFPHVQAGTVKALAISEKDEDFPDIKTFEEQGITGGFSNYKALFLRKGTPEDRKKVLIDACRKTLQDKSYLHALKRVGTSPGTLVGEEFNQFIINEDQAIGKVAKGLFTK